MTFEIDGREIGNSMQPYVIAELSANHNGSLARAKESIKAARDSGAHAIKLQTYTADTMTIDCVAPGFVVSGGLWDGYKLYDLYAEAHTPFEWHRELFDYARALGITCFSSPFDETAVDLLESLNAPAYKIASFELTDLPLIKRVAKAGKPILMSTGMATEEEILEAITTARSAGCENILIFHCISSYPAPIEQANLRKVLNLKDKFGVEVGLSDHTMGNVAAVTSVALGATAIEKHFTISRDDKGPDSEFSIEPDELRKLVDDTKNAWLSLGVGDFSRPETERSSAIFRRSLYFVKDVAAGQRISRDDIRRIRPGYGLPPKYFDEIVGRTVMRNVYRGQPVAWDNFTED
jgi:N-acetylneuraminate synthase